MNSSLMARVDPHSVTDDTQPHIESLDWAAEIFFETKQLVASVQLVLAKPVAGEGKLDLDARNLHIQAVTDQQGRALSWTALPADSILGTPLRIELLPGTTRVHMEYRTAPHASALQWLTPEQTSQGRHPFLFSQCQAIHARSIVPCQDTPARRITYRAQLTVPKALTAVMAAAPTEVHEGTSTRTFCFEMRQPIPPYLLALAVGDLTSQDLSPRSRVWAEPNVVAAAAHEFAHIEGYIEAAEQLFGAYDWERFDILVMPPSFPYGGMENPRLTFVTPALLAGDRSLVNVVAHELAHSWTGNLVTNLNAEHFWLNEGFTVYAERRILEVIEGRDVAEMHAALGRVELDEAVERFRARNAVALTSLRPSLTGVDPDEAFSVVPYEKGYLFLRVLEEALGRRAFDALLKAWLQAHRFGSVTTDDFVAHCEQVAPGALERVHAREWLEAPGVPATAPKPLSARLELVRAQLGRVPEQADVHQWSALEWQLFLDWGDKSAPVAQVHAVDARFQCSTSHNAEIQVAWLKWALRCGDTSVVPAVESVVSRLGRMKYLKPLFELMHANAQTRGEARRLFEKYRARFHPIAAQVIGGMLEKP